MSTRDLFDRGRALLLVSAILLSASLAGLTGASGIVQPAVTQTEGVTVALDPGSASVEPNGTATFEVVVDGTDAGVGSYDLSVSTSDVDRAVVAGASSEIGAGSRSSVAPDGSSARVAAFGADTADTGPVTVATVTVRGETPGSVDLSVTVSSVSNETGDQYAVGSTAGATLSVTATPTPTPDTPTPDTPTPTPDTPTPTPDTPTPTPDTPTPTPDTPTPTPDTPTPTPDTPTPTPDPQPTIDPRPERPDTPEDTSTPDDTPTPTPEPTPDDDDDDDDDEPASTPTPVPPMSVSVTAETGNTTDNRSAVNATVRNARAGEPVSVNVSRPDDRNRTAAIDEIRFTPERDGNFSLAVTQAAERIEGMPPFDRSDATAPASFLVVTHTISNEQVSNVSIEFRVSKERIGAIENTERDEVALYRFENGTYVELPTRFDGETDTHFRYVADSPGLSDFATGIKQARFRIADATVSVTRIRSGDDVEVVVRVTNTGSADGTYELDLRASNETVATRDLTVAPNGTRQTVFREAFTRPATYELFVNDLFVANLAVESDDGTPPTTAGTTGAGGDGGDGGDDTPATGDGSPTAAETAPDGTDAPGGGAGATDTTTTGSPGFGATAALAALAALAAIVLLARRD